MSRDLRLLAGAGKSESRESRAMETGEVSSRSQQQAAGEIPGSEVLLDLGEFKPARAAVTDDFVLDLDLDEAPEPSPAEPAFSGSAFLSKPSYTGNVGQSSSVGAQSPSATVAEAPLATPDQLANTLEFQRITNEPEVAPTTFEETESVAHVAEPIVADQYSPTPSAAGEVSPQQLSPEMIDAIARRAVEQLSEKAVQEIAWEVVPQLAELLIKRQLEEKNS